MFLSLGRTIRSKFWSRFRLFSSRHHSLQGHFTKLCPTDPGFFASICWSPWQDFRNMSHLGLTLNTGLRCGEGGSYIEDNFPEPLCLKALGFLIICCLNIKKSSISGFLATSKALPRWTFLPNPSGTVYTLTEPPLFTSCWACGLPRTLTITSVQRSSKGSKSPISHMLSKESLVPHL